MRRCLPQPTALVGSWLAGGVVVGSSWLAGLSLADVCVSYGPVLVALALRRCGGLAPAGLAGLFARQLVGAGVSLVVLAGGLGHDG